MKVKSFKSFYRTGEVSESAALDHKERMVHSLVDELRQCGYVPVLGVGPYYTQQYDFENDMRVFHLTLHGAYVGKERAKELEGVDVFTGQELGKPTQKSK